MFLYIGLRFILFPSHFQTLYEYAMTRHIFKLSYTASSSAYYNSSVSSNYYHLLSLQ
nr:MAG TPA: hypothetical protein [Caudoviricetes sp.]